MFKNRSTGWLKKHGPAIGFAFILAVLSPGVPPTNWNLGYQAQLVRRMRGKDLPLQNDWDFGQTVALMIWLLVAWELLTVIRKSRTLCEIKRC